MTGWTGSAGPRGWAGGSAAPPFRRIPGCRLLPALVLGVLLALSGLVPSQNSGPRGSVVAGPSPVSSTAAPGTASAPSGPGTRTSGRPAGPAVSDTGSSPAASSAGRIVPLVERAMFEQHRTSPGPGDHQATGPDTGVPPVVPPGPAFPERTAATPPSAPGGALAARAPPVS